MNHRAFWELGFKDAQDYSEWANATYEDPWLPKHKQTRSKRRNYGKRRKHYRGGKMRIRVYR